MEKGIKLDLVEKVAFEKRLKGDERAGQRSLKIGTRVDITQYYSAMCIQEGKMIGVGQWVLGEERSEDKNDQSGLTLRFLAQVSFIDLWDTKIWRWKSRVACAHAGVRCL